nr:hypothetical protein [Bacteroidota bacterium]
MLDQVNAFGDKVVDGKIISRHLTFDDNAGIWHYHKFRVYLAIRDKHYELALINQLIQKFEEILVYSNFDLSVYLENKNVKFLNRNQKKKIQYFDILIYGIYLLMRIITGLFQSKNNRNKKHLVIEKGELQPVVREDLSVKPGNYILEYLLQKLTGDFLIVNQKDIPKFVDGKKFRIKPEYFINRNHHIKRIHSEYYLFAGLISRKVRIKQKKICSRLSQRYGQLRSHANSAFERDVITEYEKLHKTSCYYILNYLIYCRLFQKSSFTTVTTVDENSPSVKPILDAAKRNGVETIGIQHGNIYDLLMSYRYTEKDAGFNVMPDLTLVWGDYFKKFLLETCNYPSAKLAVAGQIRTDIIPMLSRSSSTNPFSDIGPSKQILMFASQPQPDATLRKQAALDVFEATRINPDLFLIIKLHPAEKYDFDYYHRLAKQANCANYKIVYAYDLYLTISMSSIVVTCYSTVGSEAIYFNKPLIILDHQKQDLLKYHASGVAFQATNGMELRKIIGGIVNRELTINQQAYNHFIDQYAYKIDGKSADRCIRMIRSQQ